MTPPRNARFIKAGASLRPWAWIAGCLVSIALGASCATGETPQGGEEGKDEVDGGFGTLPPPGDAGGSSGVDAAAGDCPTDPCDLHEQCGCPEQDACDLDFTDFEQDEFSDQLACRGVAQPGDELSTCSGPEECAAGYQCLSGQCYKYCQEDDDCGGPGGACVYTRSGSERDDDSLCSKSCEPDFEADHSESCPASFACYISFVGADDDRAITNCLSEGGLSVNEDCSEGRCGEGLTCITFTDSEGQESQRCQRRCRVDDQTCLDGEACEGFEPPTLVDGTEYGFCRSEN